MEKPPSQEKAPHFQFPSFQPEDGEIERVREHFEFLQENFTELFLELAYGAKLTDLSEAQWDSLENSDSYDIQKGDWDTVAKYAEGQKVPRDWKDLRQKLQNGVALDAPVMVKVGNTLHLVSGNTRLMVSRALGIIPEVLIVDITDLA